MHCFLQPAHTPTPPGVLPSHRRADRPLNPQHLTEKEKEEMLTPFGEKVRTLPQRYTAPLPTLLTRVIT